MNRRRDERGVREGLRVAVVVPFGDARRGLVSHPRRVFPLGRADHVAVACVAGAQPVTREAAGAIGPTSIRGRADGPRLPTHTIHRRTEKTGGLVRKCLLGK